MSNFLPKNHYFLTSSPDAQALIQPLRFFWFNQICLSKKILLILKPLLPCNSSKFVILEIPLFVSYFTPNDAAKYPEKIRMPEAS